MTPWYVWFLVSMILIAPHLTRRHAVGLAIFYFGMGIVALWRLH